MTEAEKKKYFNKKYGRSTGRKVYRSYIKATKQLEKKCLERKYDNIMKDIFHIH